MRKKSSRTLKLTGETQHKKAIMIFNKKFLVSTIIYPFFFGTFAVMAQSNSTMNGQSSEQILKHTKGLKLNMQPKPAKQIDPIVGHWRQEKIHLIRGFEGRTSFAHDSLEIKHSNGSKYTIKKHSIFPDGKKHEHEISEYVLEDGVLIGIGSKLMYSGVDTKFLRKGQIISELGNKLYFANRTLEDVESGIKYIK